MVLVVAQSAPQSMASIEREGRRGQVHVGSASRVRDQGCFVKRVSGIQSSAEFSEMPFKYSMTMHKESPHECHCKPAAYSLFEGQRVGKASAGLVRA